eukprot:CAMPEP_0179079424 /NCGR_PEP_ID=MMETSP0796-20121207/35635_1 /TAXON_ID=73915 /ORGANISM="Pyrodinium bahamense, Strain pbaha01" /LENGTH=157 /DNA_ID=CAMNT_0020776759 /DNA_START=468 /DNA_END=943 /DNA_ORIENTATION=-
MLAAISALVRCCTPTAEDDWLPLLPASLAADGAATEGFAAETAPIAWVVQGDWKVVPPLSPLGVGLGDVHLQSPPHVARILCQVGLLPLRRPVVLAVGDDRRPRLRTLAAGAEPVLRILRDTAAVLPPQPRGEVGRGHQGFDPQTAVVPVAVMVGER